MILQESHLKIEVEVKASDPAQELLEGTKQGGLVD